MRDPCEQSQANPDFLLACEHAKAAGLKPRICYRNLAVPQAGYPYDRPCPSSPYSLSLEGGRLAGCIAWCSLVPSHACKFCSTDVFPVAVRDGAEARARHCRGLQWGARRELRGEDRCV